MTDVWGMVDAPHPQPLILMLIKLGSHESFGMHEERGARRIPLSPSANKTIANTKVCSDGDEGAGGEGFRISPTCSCQTSEPSKNNSFSGLARLVLNFPLAKFTRQPYSCYEIVFSVVCILTP